MVHWLLSSCFFGVILCCGLMVIICWKRSSSSFRLILSAVPQQSFRVLASLQTTFHLVFTRLAGKAWIEKDIRNKKDWSKTIGADTNNETFMGSEDLGELLPGIINDVTLALIVSKLSWGDVLTLSKVNRSWRQAFQTRMVHDARVSSQSLETLAIVNHLIPNPRFSSGDDSYWIPNLSLYSMRNKSWYDLPALPRGTPHECECIALDGKFYVMGGGNLAMAEDGAFHSRGGDLEDELRTKEVYVLDLAGKRQWRQCASMHTPRANFCAGVLNGKIYVFGGCPGGSGPEYGSEMYDPKEDVWSPIQSVISEKALHQKVAAVGNELFLYGGFDKSKSNDSDGEDMDHGEIHREEYWDRPMLLEAYDPVKNETRVIQPSLMTLLDNVFITNERFHRMTDYCIDVYDFERNLWIPLHSFSQFLHETITRVSREAGCTVALDDENLLVHCLDSHGIINRGAGLLLSTSSEGSNQEISWEIVECPFCFAGYSCSPDMYPIQL